MILGGIDGCKYGWILIKSFNNKMEFGGLYPSIQHVMESNQDLDRIVIDMPIGLSSKSSKRTLDLMLKKELKARHSTVFITPCRETLNAKNHQEASQINKEIEGKGISIQAYYISQKIDQVDQLLIGDKTLRDKFIESHPELCFKYLNGGEIIVSNKSTQHGLNDRLNILQRHYAESVNLYERIVKETPRKLVKRDDIIDALCLCLVNILSKKNNMSFIHDPLLEDSKGIKMRIGYFKK
jgi:8-oxo-dGTP diphosphatase